VLRHGGTGSLKTPIPGLNFGITSMHGIGMCRTSSDTPKMFMDLSYGMLLIFNVLWCNNIASGNSEMEPQRISRPTPGNNFLVFPVVLTCHVFRLLSKVQGRFWFVISGPWTSPKTFALGRPPTSGR
jgi:hypothetical protein